MVLVIEDDPTYSRIVLDAAHERSYKVLLATRGDMGLAMARKFLPMAVLLDIGLPDTTGWAVLDQFQHDPDLRHIPVHMLSIFEDRRRGLSLGASSYFRKVEGREVLDNLFERVKQTCQKSDGKILVINAGSDLRRDMESVADLDGVKVTYAESAVEALDSFESTEYDCVIVGVGESEVSAADLLVELQKNSRRDLELIAYTPEGGTAQDLSLAPFREGTIVRTVDSADRLLREVTRMLHIPRKRAARISAHQARKAAPERSRTGGQQGAHRGRRRAQYFRLNQHPGAASDPGGSRRKRARGNRNAGAIAGDRYRADGYHDAGHGWLRNHPLHPRGGCSCAICPSSR